MSLIKVIEVGTNFQIRFDYNPNLVKEVKKIKGRKWHPSDRYWTVPKSEKETLDAFVKKHNEKELQSNPFSNGFFLTNPIKVLGKEYTHNPNTGKLLIDQFGKPRPEVRGSIVDIEKIDAPNATYYNHWDVEKTNVKRVDSKKTNIPVSKIKQAIQKTVNETKAHKDRNNQCHEGLQCLGDTILKYNTDIEYKDKDGNTKFYTISEEEIKAWVTYQTNQGLFDLNTIRNNDWGKYYVPNPDWLKWWEKGFVVFDGENFIPEALYYSGNIYKKVESIKNKKEVIVGKIGNAGFEKQLQKMEDAKPIPLLITDDESRKLHLSPFHKIWSQIDIKELADGSQLENDLSIGAIFYYNYLKDLSAEELTIDKKSTSAYDIAKYWIKKDNFPRGKYTDTEKAIIKRNTTMIGSYHFDKFLLESLTRDDRVKIAAIWNSDYNNYKDVDYHRIPVGFKVGSMFKGGVLGVRPAQREGVAFMNYRGTGIVAYDVGVGKTMTSILAISDGFEKGLFKRPLVVVPQKVYKKWIGEIIGVFAPKAMKIGKKAVKKGDLIAEGILPHVKINDYDNLGVNFIGKAVDEHGVAFTVNEFSITMITYEGLNKIGFSEDSENDLVFQLKTMLSQGESGRARAIVEQKAEGWIDKALKQTEIDIEEMGIDAIFVDEAHNFRNLFMEVKGDVGEDGDREKKNFMSGGGSSPSGRALKLFMLNSYIHSKNSNRNTFGLTATPFTNRATEIYSMLAHYDYQGLKDFNVYNIAQFCTNFIDEKLESVWTASGKYDIKAVIRGYENLPVLQSMVFRSINYKTGEEANIQRPEKVILPLNYDDTGTPLAPDHIVETKLPPTPEQQKWLNAIRQFALNGTGSIAEHYQPDSDGKIPGQVLIALNAARTVTFSPFAIKLDNTWQYDIDELTPKEFVDGSPKIKYVCECIKSVKQYHNSKKTDVSGQLVYSDRGTSFFPLIKEYLIENAGFKPNEIEIFHGGVSKSKRERIKEGFLNNSIKVVIGSSTMREGVDLQKHCSTIYVCYLDWNPTDLHQLYGRGWRFGNKFSHIRIVVPLIENSSDIHTWQKLSEKMSRLNSIWTRSNKTKMFEESELNAEELKKGLINDPEELAKFEIIQEVSVLDSELKLQKASYKELEEAQEMKAKFGGMTLELDDLAKEATQYPKDLEWNVKPERIAKLKAMEITDEKSVYRIVRAYANLRSYWNRSTLREKVEQHVKYRKRLKKVEEGILKKNKLSLSDDFTSLMDEIRLKIQEIEGEILEIKSEEHKQKVLEKIILEKEEMEKGKKPVSERVNDFARLNYLLDCFYKIHNCDIYGRIEEAETGKVIEVKETQPKVSFDIAHAYKMSLKLKRFMPPHQQKAVKEMLKGEEAEGLIEQVFKRLDIEVAAIPKIGEQANLSSDETTIFAHFFLGGSDWYISEWDGKDRLFGYAILNGDKLNAEWGYMSLNELRTAGSGFNKPEMDFYWEVRTFENVLGEKQKAAISKKPISEKERLLKRVKAFEIASKYARGSEKTKLLRRKKAFEIAAKYANTSVI